VRYLGGAFFLEGLGRALPSATHAFHRSPVGIVKVDPLEEIAAVVVFTLVLSARLG
jgi:hypothetical protein